MPSINLQEYEVKKPESAKEQKKADAGSWLDFLNKDIQIGSTQMKDSKKEWFYSELNILLSAGVDIKTALELIAEGQSKKKDVELFTGIKNEIINGESLSGALKRTGKFSAHEYYSLRIGEQSGKISEVLQDLSGFFNKKIAQKRQIINALSYPVIVMLTAFGAIFFMMNFIVPMFADIFKRTGGELPVLTQYIIAISEWISAYGGVVFLVIFGLTGFTYFQRKADWYRKAASAIIIKIPIAGDMVKKIYLARLCYSMNLLLSAKTPLLESINLVQKMVGFYPIEKSLESVKELILKGQPLYEAMESFPIYNRRMLSLIKVAEEVNQLDTIFAKLAEQYNDEVEHQTGLISSLLEPFIIIFLGLFVAIILIAMYLPLFQLSTSFGV